MIGGDEKMMRGWGGVIEGVIGVRGDDERMGLLKRCTKGVLRRISIEKVIKRIKNTRRQEDQRVESREAEWTKGREDRERRYDRELMILRPVSVCPRPLHEYVRPPSASEQSISPGR